ncbi:hypothetical protein Tco_1016720 [Tanacetum coccineum]|uniref:Reverse transcriptase zinc-binding domain-containing protein n=1 Tax=Tanacetum coccineum TaxID=301880 RepID=A0ABQ5FPF2_9ASTR
MVEIIPTDLWYAPWLSDQLEWNLWHAPWLSDHLEWNLWHAPWLCDQLEWNLWPKCEHDGNKIEESSCHIFFQCNLVRQLARKISSWWNVDYVDVSSYEEWYTWLVSLRLQANLKAVFEGIFYCLWWSVWMFRNKILFEKDTPSQARIFDNIVSNSYYWCKFRCKASFKWIDWLKNPYLVIV